MSENKKMIVIVMLLVVTIAFITMANAFFIVKPSIISSDNKLIQECLTRKVSCAIYISRNYGLSYIVNLDGLSSRVDTEKEALEFFKKAESIR